MPITDHVSVTVRRVRAAVSESGFGTLCALDAHRLWEDRYRSIASLAELEDAGASACDALHRLATVYFGQPIAPAALGIGRRDCGDNVWCEVAELASEASYDLTIGGLLHRIATAPNATAELVAGKLVTQINGGYEITVVAVGPPGVFTIAGDHLDEFTAGQTFTVMGSTGNDATYTVASVALVGGNTAITVTLATALPSAVADGHIGGYAVTACTAGASGTFTTPGDVRDRFPVGLEFGVSGSTNNDNRTGSGTVMAGIPYTVASTALVAGNTVITINSGAGQVVPGALGANGGGIVSWADGATAVSTVVADLLTWAIAVVVPGAGGTFAIAGDVTSLFPAGTRFRITGATAATNDGMWTVGSSVFTAPNTVITVVGSETVIAGGIALGNISLPILRISPEDAAQFYTVHASDRLRLRFAITNAAATDLTTVRNASDAWYAACLTTRLMAQVTSLSGAVEAITDAPKLAGFGSGDPNIVDTTVTADSPITGSVAARLAGLDRLRSFVIYSGDDAGRDGTQHDVWTGYSENEDPDDPFVEAALFGKYLPTLPGATDCNLQELEGIVADDLTSAQRTNALAKNCNVYATITSTADGLQPGNVANNDPIDSVRDLDWLRYEMETRLFNRLHATNNAGRKTPYTDRGFAALEGEIRAVMDLAIAYGVINDDPGYEYDLTVPTLAGQSSANHAARLVTGFVVEATQAGAVRRISMTIEVEL